MMNYIGYSFPFLQRCMLKVAFCTNLSALISSVASLVVEHGLWARGLQ